MIYKIDDIDLKDLGFTYGPNPWSKKDTWMHLDDGKYTPTNFIIRYDIEEQKAIAVLGEFCIFGRTCRTFKDLKTFVEATYFINTEDSKL